MAWKHARCLPALLAALLGLTGVGAAAIMASATPTTTRSEHTVTAIHASTPTLDGHTRMAVNTTRNGGQEITTRADGSVVVRTIADKDGGQATTYSGCQVYYPEDAVINLATAAKDDDCWDSSMLHKTNATGEMTFLGWNQENDPHTDVTTSAEKDAAHVVNQVTMPKGGLTVYAVWANMPILRYDVNQPDESKQTNPTAPATPGNETVTLGQPFTDNSGWTTGDTDKLKGWRFDGWYADPTRGDPYDWKTPADKAETTVYAHWTRLAANVLYDANGGQGSHEKTPGWQYSTIVTPKDLDGSFKRVGYRLSGWNTCPDPKIGANCVAYTAGDSVPAENRDVTLYAQWTPLLSILPSAGGSGQAPIAWPWVIGLSSAALLAALSGGATMLKRRRRTSNGRHGR